MHSRLQPTFDQNLAATQYDLNENDYDAQRTLNIIRRYHELRSAAEITAAQYGHVSSGSGLSHGKDGIICVLIDIDRGVALLPLRQQVVVTLLKMGYLIKEISTVLGIRQVTVKWHIRQASFRLATYLNALNAEKGWGK